MPETSSQSNVPNTSHVKNQGGKKKRLVLLLLAALCVIGMAEGASVALRAPLWPVSAFWKTSQDTEVIISQGEGGTALAHDLFDKHIISNVQAFLAELTHAGADAKLIPGTYVLNGTMSEADLVAQLLEGPNSSKGKFTVPEGYTVTQVAELAERTLGISKEAFLSAAKASRFKEEFSFLDGVHDDSLEGFLYGSTYDFSGAAPSADEVIRTMLAQFEAKAGGLDYAGAAVHIKETYGIEMDEYTFINFASVLQQEGKTVDDYRKIAGVFYNRLKVGMNLQSDATLKYELGRAASAEELTVDSAYNSYTRPGLPPTPICSPSLDCIQAALDPEVSDNLYFLMYDDGVYSNHAFSKTYEEHLAAIEKARQEGAKL